MKVNELRIGNWYLSTKFQTPVICEMGDMYEIYMRADGSTEYTVDDVFQPIPLTEEWLLKFGLELHLHEGLFWDEYTHPKTFDSITRHKKDHSFAYDFEDGAVELKYVHQLQNLYFALNGEELNTIN
jgi:hypothetical protein